VSSFTIGERFSAGTPSIACSIGLVSSFSYSGALASVMACFSLVQTPAGCARKKKEKNPAFSL
jgi:hypothetical protein